MGALKTPGWKCSPVRVCPQPRVRCRAGAPAGSTIAGVQYPDYNPALDAPPLSDAELDALDTTLQSLATDDAMNVEMLDGYLTALALSPVPVAGRRAAEWLPAVWGGDGEGASPFESQRQRKHMVVQVLQHLHAIDRQLRQDPAHWEPVFSVAESADGDELADAEDWCIGFLQAVALDADAWEPLFDDAALGPALVPVVVLGAEEAALTPADRERLLDPVQRDALSRAVADAVVALSARPR